jgi:hypothetical protein
MRLAPGVRRRRAIRLYPLAFAAPSRRPMNTFVEPCLQVGVFDEAVG